MSSPFPPGAIINHFELQAEIGRGGMGVVYRARDLQLDRPVAIKILAPHLVNDADALARFHREAAAAANLRHPHIAAVYEFGDYLAQPYLAIEWIDGRTLKEMIAAEGPLAPARAARLAEQIAAALDYAHARGVIHRDIKPANILVDARDHATIVDFGLAWLANAPSITTGGVVFGTPRYMAPEQIRGDPVDARADQYSLANVVYEMLAGRAPFDDEAIPALLYKLGNVTPPPVTQFNSNLPTTLNLALGRALAKKPADRFATAREFADAVQNALNLSLTHPLRPYSLSPRRRAPQAPARAIGILALIAVAAACVLIATGVWSFAAQIATVPETATPAPTPLVLATATFQPTVSSTAAITATLPTPTAISGAAPLDNGAWPMVMGDGAQTGFVAESFARYNAKPRWRHDPQGVVTTGLIAQLGFVVFGLNNTVMRALDWSDGQVAWETQLGSRMLGQPALAFGNGYDNVITAGEDRELHALSFLDGRLVWRKKGDVLRGDILGGVTVGADGALFAATDTGWVHSINPANGAANWSLDLSRVDRFRFAPALAGNALYLAGGNQFLRAIDLSTKQLLWQASTNGAPTSAPCAAQTAGVIAIGTDKGTVHAFSSIGKEVWKAQLSGAMAGMATDGARLYVTVVDGSLIALNGGSGKQEWVLKTGVAIASAPLTDGKTVLIATKTGDMRFVDAETGRETSNTRLALREPVDFAPAPAGGWLFARGTNVYAFGP